jgi:SOS-response transcriptional repressor LexA
MSQATPPDNPPPLTEKQRAIYRFLINFTLENLHQPSMEEVAAHFAIPAGRSGAAAHMKALARKGYIRAGSGQPRAVEFLVRPEIVVTVTWPKELET